MDEAGGASTLGELLKVYNGLRARCLLCGAVSRGSGLCAGCHGDLARPAGIGCGLELSFITACFAAFEYTYPLDRIIRDSKFSRDLAALASCAVMLTSEVSPYLPEVDLVVPVPLSRWRYIARGYNQAREIARPLAAARGFRLDRGEVRRRRHRAPQSRLPAAERAANVSGVFVCRRRYAGERILIVDDVITTGATIVELARTLKAAGAGPVYAAALAVVL